MNDKYVAPDPWYIKVLIYLGIIVSPIILFFLYKLAKKLYLDWEASKDRSYNVFDKAELSRSEKR